MGKNKNIKFLIIAAIFILPIFVLNFFITDSTTEAKAASVDFDYAECTNFDGDTEVYDDNSVYARDIKLYYDISSPYYSIIVYSSSGRELEKTQPREPESGKGSYTVDENGEVTVRCYAVDSEGIINESLYVDTIVRSDNLEPKEAEITQMTDWVRHQNGFYVEITLDEDEGNAGTKRADISIVYGEDDIVEREIVSPSANDGFHIYEECEIVMNIYDYAGNKYSNSYTYNKFDSEPPTPPSFNFTPNVEVGDQTNGYARKYNVSIDYGEDSKSGIKTDSMIYILNGQQEDYDGGFVLKEQKNYTIEAYYQDNAGNTSEVISETINNIDRIEPVIDDLKLKVDLKK